MLLRSKIRRLPPVHQATLKAIIEHLARVAAKSEKNKMDPKNLAIVFGSVIFSEDEMPKAGDLLSVQHIKVSFPLRLQFSINETTFVGFADGRFNNTCPYPI
jgi:flavorubredoxin